MSNRFDTALMERERNRQLLAAVLDEKYDQERRNKRITRLAIVGFIVGLGFAGMRGADIIAESSKPQDLTRKKEKRDIISQMKKQISQGDQVVISAKEKPKSEDAGNAPKRESMRVKANADSFAQEKIPLNLYADLKRAQGGGKPNPGYSPPLPRGTQELQGFAQRLARRPKVDCGRYRPMGASDQAKLPPRRPSNPPFPSLYLPVSQPTAALAQDLQAFPGIQK
ncbi:MAG TPA: hypothetical protein VIH99_05280 [Bdellovibrionota bacterium]|jgi:hypothetical protein